MNTIAERLRHLADSHGLPGPEYLSVLLDSVRDILDSEPVSVRPADKEGLPGGLVQTETALVLLVPDLHARVGLLADLLESTIPGHDEMRVVSLLSEGKASLICLGDVPHSEGRRAAELWRSAAQTAIKSGRPDGILSAEMDEEMGASLRTLCAVMELKLAFPSVFHCLKGNHDNMTNAVGDGDLAFYKYASEGSMGADWFRLRFGTEILAKARRYERSLPLVSRGLHYCASHAEPAFPMSAEQIINNRHSPDIVRALIWTGNDEAEPGSVEKTMGSLLGEDGLKTGRIWFSGHRAVAGGYKLRAGGLLAQIHNPERRQVAILDDVSDFTDSRARVYAIRPGGGDESRSLLLSESIGFLPA